MKFVLKFYETQVDAISCNFITSWNDFRQGVIPISAYRFRFSVTAKRPKFPDPNDGIVIVYYYVSKRKLWLRQSSLQDATGALDCFYYTK
jgi:hypothetical protein